MTHAIGQLVANQSPPNVVTPQEMEESIWGKFFQRNNCRKFWGGEFFERSFVGHVLGNFWAVFASIFQENFLSKFFRDILWEIFENIFVGNALTNFWAKFFKHFLKEILWGTFFERSFEGIYFVGKFEGKFLKEIFVDNFWAKFLGDIFCKQFWGTFFAILGEIFWVNFFKWIFWGTFFERNFLEANF